MREPGIVEEHEAVVPDLEVVQVFDFKLERVVKITQVVRADVPAFQDLGSRVFQLLLQLGVDQTREFGQFFGCRDLPFAVDGQRRHVVRF